MSTQNIRNGRNNFRSRNLVIETGRYDVATPTAAIVQEAKILGLIGGTTGPTGSIGSTGVQGSQGLQGVAGISSNTGAQGYQGLQGLVGVTGSQGVQGLIGATGLQGYQGFQGLVGVTGSQGSQGLIGATGLQGYQGFQGLVGVTGSQGVQGLIGSQGLQGYQGFQGLIGTTGSQGYQGFQGLQGLQGTTGTQGNQGFQGLEGPITSSYSFEGSVTFRGATLATGASSSNNYLFGDYYSGTSSYNWQLLKTNEATLNPLSSQRVGPLMFLCPTTLSNINGIINLIWAESNTALFPVTVNVYLYKNTFSNALTTLDTGKTELYNSSFTFTNGGTITNTFPISITGANLSQTDILFVTFTTNKASSASTNFSYRYTFIIS